MSRTDEYTQKICDFIWVTLNGHAQQRTIQGRVKQLLREFHVKVYDAGYKDGLSEAEEEWRW